jgi:carbon starvation protein
LLSVTFTAGLQKIWHDDPRIGFLAQAASLNEKLPALGQAVSAARATGDVKAIETAEKAVHTNRTLRFNNLLDALVAGTFLALVSVIVLMSVREWMLLLSRRKPAMLHETEPVWLPDYAVGEAGRSFSGIAGTAALTLALAKELSGEAQLERAQAQVCQCSLAESEGTTNPAGGRDRGVTQGIYVEITEQRFNGVRRCC